MKLFEQQYAVDCTDGDGLGCVLNTRARDGYTLVGLFAEPTESGLQHLYINHLYRVVWRAGRTKGRK